MIEFNANIVPFTFKYKGVKYTAEAEDFESYVSFLNDIRNFKATNVRLANKELEQIMYEERKQGLTYQAIAVNHGVCLETARKKVLKYAGIIGDASVRRAVVSKKQK